MRGTKYLLYPAALVVVIWAVHGVTSIQPEKPVGVAPTISVQDIGPRARSQVNQLVTLTVAATNSPAR